MAYTKNFLSIIDTIKSYATAGTIQNMIVESNTNFTINADASKIYFDYTSGTQHIHKALKLPKLNSQGS